MKSISIIMVLLITAQIAVASPTPPAAFYGTVKINGIDAPVGTIITANMSSPTAVNGSIITIEAGKYGGGGGFDPKLEVQGDSTDIGKVIIFWVKRPEDAGFIKADQTSKFNSGTTPLALSVGGSPAATSKPPDQGGDNKPAQTTLIPGATSAITATPISATSTAAAEETTPADKGAQKGSSNLAGIIIAMIIAVIIIYIAMVYRKK